MIYADAVAAPDGFNRRRIIGYYAIIGAVAATAFTDPIHAEGAGVSLCGISVPREREPAPGADEPGPET